MDGTAVWNTSERWSSYGSGTMAGTNYSWEKCFNGGPNNKDNTVMPDFNETASWEIPQEIGSSVVFYYNRQNNNTGKLIVNGSERTVSTNGLDTFTALTVNEPLKSFSIERGDQGPDGPSGGLDAPPALQLLK